MTLDLIGAGFGRTGTLSLKIALERLGLTPCYHMTEVIGNPRNAGHAERWHAAARGEAVDWDELLAGYRATVDWPGCSFWESMRARWPEARVLLSKRDPDAWYRSVMRTIRPGSQYLRSAPDPSLRRVGEMVERLIWQDTFDGRIDDRDHAVAVFERHNAAVEASVPADRLLVYEPGEGWERLCTFLGRPVPDEPFPHANSSEEFQERFATGVGDAG